jgi:DNA polymerase-1
MDDTSALYLVDGSGFIFRAYHALPPLSTKAGVPSGAVYGFTQMLIKLETEHRPTHLAVVFDAGGRSFRDEVYAEYKANRVEPPDDLKPQFGMVRQVVAAFGVPILEAIGFEADDLIATLVRRAKEHGLRVVIVSSDKDLMQLVDDRCVLVDTMKPKDFVYGTAEVEEKFGVGPAQLGDVLALMGDSVDNIPGIPGVGPKTAAALIRHFGSLEALLARTDEIGSVPRAARRGVGDGQGQGSRRVGAPVAQAGVARRERGGPHGARRA